MVPSFTRFDCLESIRISSGHPDHSAGLFLYAAAYDAGARRRGGYTVVEIGMDHGYSTLMLLSGIYDSPGCGRLLSIDINKDCRGVYDVRRLPDRIGDFHQFIIGDSTDQETVQRAMNIVHSSGDVGIYLLFLDGGHDHKTCLSDLRNYGQHVLPDGRIYVHDARHQPVRDAIGDFCSEFGFQRGHIRGYGNLEVLSKD